MKRNSILRTCALLLAMIFLAVMSAGCGKGDDEQAQSGGAGGGQPSITLKYPAALSAESSPREVAQMLIQALEEDDTPTLLGLVAAKRETEEFAAIYRKHGRRPPASLRPEKAAAAAVAGWRATYSFFQPGKTEIAEEKVEVNSAIFTASGVVRDGSAQRFNIRLIREDGLWKICAGLKSPDRR